MLKILKEVRIRQTLNMPVNISILHFQKFQFTSTTAWLFVYNSCTTVDLFREKTKKLTGQAAGSTTSQIPRNETLWIPATATSRWYLIIITFSCPEYLNILQMIWCRKHIWLRHVLRHDTYYMTLSKEKYWARLLEVGKGWSYCMMWWKGAVMDSWKI